MARDATPKIPIRACFDCGEPVEYTGVGQPRKRCAECQMALARKRARDCYAQRKERFARDGVVPLERKSCGGCGKEKDAAEFGKATGRADGLQYWCKSCVRAHRLANPEQYNERSRRFRARHPERGIQYLRAARKAALEHYSLTSPPSCSCCTEDEPAFLVLDHVHGGGTAHRRELGGHIFSWLRTHGYPDGFQVLCWNCNAAKAYQGICPHQVGKQVPLCVS